MKDEISKYAYKSSHLLIRVPGRGKTETKIKLYCQMCLYFLKSTFNKGVQGYGYKINVQNQEHSCITIIAN